VYINANKGMATVLDKKVYEYTKKYLEEPTVTPERETKETQITHKNNDQLFCIDFQEQGKKPLPRWLKT
jgi:hypothetical protein